LLRLLPRSALGQSIVNYVDVMTGVRSAGDAHGARHVYIVLADSGRSALLASSQKAALRCIRCGACMNHCPVYQHVGGHSYGWVYPGPIGAVLTPAYQGLEHAIELPHACTLCGQCASVCPVKIPLPELQRELREQQTVRGLRPRSERLALRLWAWGALHPRLYGASTRIAARVLAWWGGRDGRIRRLPLGGGGGWTAGRDLIAPSGRTFKELWRERRQH
jgi:L-lactate dehydrogenase complex protein LldF